MAVSRILTLAAGSVVWAAAAGYGVSLLSEALFERRSLADRLAARASTALESSELAPHWTPLTLTLLAIVVLLPLLVVWRAELRRKP
jgi:hypothetical protein